MSPSLRISNARRLSALGHRLPLACGFLIVAALGTSCSNNSGSSGGAGGTTAAAGGGPGAGGATTGAGGGGVQGSGGVNPGAGGDGVAAGGSLGSGAAGGSPSGAGGVVGAGGSLGGVGGSAAGGEGGALAGSGGAGGLGGSTSNGAGGSVGTGGATGAGGAPGAGGATGGGPTYPYIFSVFNDSAPLSDLIIYTSTDALNFTLLYDTKYTGPTGFLRDPSIMKHTDGKFYVAFTTPPDMGCCGAESSFSVASSANLKDWTTVATVPAGVAGVKNTWAPEWFKDQDGSVYAIVNVDGKTYRYKAMNDALTTFSGPTWIGIGPGYIDTFIVLVGGTYHAFTKNNATYIEHATSASLDGPWTFVGKNDWAGWGTHKEAPALIQLPSGSWRIYFDAGSTGHEMSSDSADMFMTWTAPKTLPVVGNNISHGTVIKGN